ncbi:MAG: protein kinase [Candidatus Eisenbacteria bacterium]|nr:protein kinase [Candidatus Eisenbacteria bacterium]
MRTSPDSPIRPTVLGRFPIEGELGRGGMGIVYRGTDPALGRPVAIKVLPPEFSADADRLIRFEREARVLAALSHPNIAAIHSLEQAGDGSRLLVLELVEGESLRDRLKRGPLSAIEAIRVAESIARALESAHGRGIIHRDVKPDNVRITPSGEVKVLDFGLARWEDQPSDDETDATLFSASVSPDEDVTSVTAAPDSYTGAGMVLGTPGYLSPEQARGQLVDRRSDIFSFGAVLFESISGHRAFPGSNAQDRVRAVVYKEPDYTQLPGEAPESVRTLIRRCLEKDPEQRLGSMRDVRVVLEAGLSESAPIPLAPTARTQNNLPHLLTSFIGRRREVAEACVLLENTRLLAVTGVGGCGKTRVALEVARDSLGAFVDGVWFVELAALSEPGMVPATVLSGLGLRDAAGATPAQSLIDHFGSRKALLVLDNCEHLLPAVSELVQQLLQACSNLRVVITSREPLGISGETIWRLPSLGTPVGRPGGERPEDLLGIESAELFVERARAIAPAFSLTAQNAPAVASICRRLDGIPLAIELAAARIRVLSAEQIDAKLSDRFRLLTGGGRGALERHQTLRAAIAWSYSLLNDEEKRCLRALSVFVRGWSLPAAAAVLGRSDDEFEILDLLSHLVDKSLLVVDEGDEPRYHLLETVRQFAAEEAERDGESAADRDAHAQWFHALARQARPQLLGAQQGEWLARLDQDDENLLAAIQWLGQHEESADRGLDLAAQLWWYWHQRGLLVMGAATLEEALTRPGVLETGEARAVAFLGSGFLWQGRGDLRRAVERFEASRRLAQLRDDRRVLVNAMQGLARVASQMGDYERARTLYDEGLPLALESKDKQILLTYLNGRGALAWHLGDQRGAQGYFVQALDVARELRNTNSIGVLLANLGAMDIQLGELASAQTRLEEALVVQRSLKNRFGEAQALCNLGSVAHARMEDVASHVYYQDSLALCEEMGSKDGRANVYYGLGELAVSHGDAPAATRYLGESRGHFEEQGDRLSVAGIDGMLSLLAADQGDLDEARRRLRASLTLHFALNPSPDILAEIGHAARLALCSGDHALAARIWAAVVARREVEQRASSPREAAGREAGLAECREVLGIARFEQILAEARKLDWAALQQEVRDWLGQG